MAAGYFDPAYFGAGFNAQAPGIPDAPAAGCDNYFDRTYFDPTYFCTDDAPAEGGGHHAVRLLQVPDEADELFALI